MAKPEPIPCPQRESAAGADSPILAASTSDPNTVAAVRNSLCFSASFTPAAQ
jgi:hypothetical protein